MTRSHFTRTALAIALLGWLAIILGPYLVMLATSVTPNDVLTRSGASLIPPEVSFDGYRQLLTGTAFLSYLRNSLLVALIAVPLTLTVGTGAAIALSRFDFPGRQAVMTGVLVAQLLPAVRLVISLQGQLRAFSLLDSRIGLALVHGHENVLGVHLQRSERGQRQQKDGQQESAWRWHQSE